MKYSSSTLAIGTISAVMASGCLSQDTPRHRVRRDASRSPEAAAAWKPRSDAIQEEIAELDDHPWAGTYHFWLPYGTLTLAPKNGFASIFQVCSMDRGDHNFGSVTLTETGSLKLNLTYKNSRYFGIAEELVPIAWGERRYLIPLDGDVGYYDSVNSEGEPLRLIDGVHYLRIGDDKKPVHGPVPELPEKYQSRLLRGPIKAEIVSRKPTTIEQRSGGWSMRKTKVTLDAGRSANVLPGMAFHVYEPDGIFIGCGARVLSVDEHTCEALITQSATDEKAPTPPAVGWKLTTGPLFGSSDCQHEDGENKPGD